MSDAWDFGTAAGIQLLRAGISYLNIDVPYVLESVSFTLAVLEGSILSNTLPDRRRLTLYPAVILILRVVFDFTSSQDTLFAILGLVGTLAGLLMGPVFHSPDDDQNNDSQKSDLRARSGQGANTHVRRVLVPSRPVTLHTVDVDTETSRQVLFTPALSLRTLPESVTVPPTSITGGDGGGGGGMSSSNHSYTRVDESFSTDDTVRYSSHLRDTDLSAPEDVYHDSAERPVTVKDTVRKLRAQAKSDDVNRRNLLAEREQVLQEGDVSRAFLLKHQADSLKKSMQESDKEAAKLIFDCAFSHLHPTSFSPFLPLLQTTTPLLVVTAHGSTSVVFKPRKPSNSSTKPSPTFKRQAATYSPSRSDDRRTLTDQEKEKSSQPSGSMLNLKESTSVNPKTAQLSS